MNPRAGITDLPHFECGPFDHLGTSPRHHIIMYERKEKVKHNFFARSNE